MSFSKILKLHQITINNIFWNISQIISKNLVSRNRKRIRKETEEKLLMIGAMLHGKKRIIINRF